MENKINLLKNNDNKDWSDLRRIEEFNDFLQGRIPDGMRLGRGHKPKLSPKQAFSVIWYLQEHFPILPDNIEKCDCCGRLFDSFSEGIYWESKGKHYCGACDYRVPENYDNNLRQ